MSPRLGAAARTSSMARRWAGSRVLEGARQGHRSGTTLGEAAGALGIASILSRRQFGVGNSIYFGRGTVSHHPYRLSGLLNKPRNQSRSWFCQLGLYSERETIMKRMFYALFLTMLSAGAALAGDEKVTLVYDQELPNVPGKSIKGVLVEYGPGGSSPAHTHPNSAFIYATVLEGAIRSSVNDGPVVTYRAGESFSEMPGDRHGVSENASSAEPAKLLAVFVVDTSETELTTPYSK
jgi:quercetin dioxygenase-like cupin family protein